MVSILASARLAAAIDSHQPCRYLQRLSNTYSLPITHKPLQLIGAENMKVRFRHPHIFSFPGQGEIVVASTGDVVEARICRPRVAEISLKDDFFTYLQLDAFRDLFDVLEVDERDVLA